MAYFKSNLHLSYWRICRKRGECFSDGVKTAVLCDGQRRVIVPVTAMWDEFFAASGIDLPLRRQPTISQHAD